MKKGILLILIVASIAKFGYSQSETDEMQKNAKHFNWIYMNNTEKYDIFNNEPNSFLVKIVADMKPGTALDVAMGEGRNTVYLAKKGWDATGFDVAEEGLKIANKKAEQAGVKIHTIQQAWQNFDFGIEKWDLVLLSYAWVPLTDTGFIKKIYSSLKKGGMVILEHPLDSPGDAPDPASGKNSVLHAFLNFHVKFYEDTKDISDWRRSADERKSTKFRTIRLMAVKE